MSGVSVYAGVQLYVYIYTSGGRGCEPYFAHDWTTEPMKSNSKITISSNSAFVDECLIIIVIALTTEKAIIWRM